jgi:hypothetical protein
MNRRIAHAAQIVAIVAALALVPAALAAKGGGGGKPSRGGTTPTGSFSLALVDSTDGVPHWGQHITFNVTSTATYYFVAVSCYQGGVRVYRQDIGFYPGWPWSKNFTLMSAAWTGGAADCNAELYSQNSDGSNYHTLATMGFPVYA